MNELAITGADFHSLPHQRQLELLAELGRDALARYDLPRNCSVSLINLSENATCKVEDPATGYRWALRIHPRAITLTPASLRARLADGPAKHQGRHHARPDQRS